MKLKLFGLVFLILLALLSASRILYQAQKNSEQRLSPKLSSLEQEIVPPQFDDKSLFLTPIKASKALASKDRVTGIVVPHHLLARDLIANAFKYASGGNYDQILLVSPDHFNLGKTDISISETGFSTVFGQIDNDTGSAKKIEQLPFVTVQNFFYREHGLGAELPFIKYYFPNAKIIALTFKESTTKSELNQIVPVLEQILGTRSLIIQSTDFSHYLSPGVASQKDDQTIKVLNSGEPDLLFGLNQPDNIDSIAAQYVQTRLQKEFFSSKLVILAHKNSQDYTKEKISSSTSYIVQGYVQPARP